MGVTPELADYIKKCISAGRTPYEIKYDLLNEGWDEADVDAAFSGTQQQYAQPAAYNQQTYAQQQRQPVQPYQQPQQRPQYPQPTPQQAPLATERIPMLGVAFSLVAVVVMLLDVIAIKSRAWVDVFNGLSVVDTSTLDVGLIVLLLVFVSGIALGGIISVKRKPLPASMLVILLSFIAMLTFAGMLSGLLGILAGIAILLKK